MAGLTRRAVFRGLSSIVAGGAAFLAACADGVTGATEGSDASDGSDLTDDTDPGSPPWCEDNPGVGPGWQAVALNEQPQLAEVGGSARLSLAGERINLVHVEDGCFVAMGTVCTHEGCAVEVRSGPRFVCPCHGALYNWQGQPIAGPAPDPLPTWPAGRDGDVIWVKIGG